MIEVLNNQKVYLGTASPESGGGGQTINNEDITITENGVYTAGEGYTGIGTATVNVPEPDIVTATNTTGASIASGDKVWLEKVAGGYNAIQSVRYYDVKGSLTDNNKVISGFTQNDYIMLFNAFNPNGSWELTTKIQTASSNTSLQGLYHSLRDASSENGKFGVAILLTTDRHFELAASANGSSWLFDQAGTYTFNNNTDYFLKIGWTGTEYYLKYSTDGSSWVDDITYASSTPIYALNVDSFLGVFHSGTNKYPFNGKIDLTETYIETNGSLWWCPYAVFDNPKILSGFSEEAIATSGTGDIRTALPEANNA